MFKIMSTETLKYPIRAWSIWLISALFMFYKNAIEVSPSIMTHDLMLAFNIGAAQIGNLTASYFYAYLLLQIPAGLLLDKFGPRKTATLAILLCASGSLLFSYSYTLPMAILGRFLTGAGAAFAFVNCIKLIANWFPPKQFAFMAGLVMTMSMLGAVGGQAPLEAFIRALDWRQATEWIGLAGLALAVIFYLIVRDKSPDHVHEKAIAPKTPLLKGVKQILKNPQSWWLSLYGGLAFAPVMVFGGLWGVAFIATQPDVSKYLAAQLVSLIFIGFAIGAPATGHLSDWLGRRRIVMAIGTLVALITLTTVIYAPHLPLSIQAILLFLFGFSISAFLLCFTLIKEISPPILAATAIGFMNAFAALCGAISDPLAGLILDARWTGNLSHGIKIFSPEAYQFAFLIIPIYLVIALLLLFKVKETYGKHTYPTTLP